MPLPGDWRAIGDRLIAGEVTVAFAWGLYKLGSQRIILTVTTMQIVTWGLSWTLERGEVTGVMLSPSALEIKLIDGEIIRPSMFWSSPFGVIYFQAGVFRNAMSRDTVRDVISQWREEPRELGEGQRGAPDSVRRRRWRVRSDLPLLLGSAAVIAAEAAAVTAWW